VAVLVDTNVLLRMSQPHHSHYSVAENALAALRLQNETLCVAAQNLIEFWVVATRPESNNGLGLTPAEAAAESADIAGWFLVLPASPEALENWKLLVISMAVCGRRAHDTHLVAVMQAHSVTKILTFNGADFKGFPGITVLEPAQF
jgi:predicted nucleic acid-binding protein